MDADRLNTSRGGSALRGSRRKSLRMTHWTDGFNQSLQDTLEMFINRGWELFQCSPLFGYSTQENPSKYTLTLRNHCAQMDEEDEDVEYKVQFNCMDKVGYRGLDTIIKVEVRKVNEEEEDIQIYLGYFMSWGTRKFSSEFYVVPLLLFRAKTTKIRNHIHTGFRKMFDCIIEPYFLGDIQLIWLNSLFVSVSKDARDERSNVVRFTLLPTWTNQDKLELFVSLSDLRKVWARIRSTNDTIFYEESRRLYGGLIRSISEKLGINLSGFRIYEIKYPDVTIKSSGKLACRNVETLHELLTFLFNEKARAIYVVDGSFWEDSDEEL
ncbi:Uncharacterized protein GBIM_16349 [Gryllus bimaculatus]|nr:Uncharacterized protein GBIM_16349 [Gryllus bimaculatus]